MRGTSAASMSMRMDTRFLHFALVQLLLVTVAHAQLTCGTQDYYLSADRRVLNITSPNYPGAYGAGSSCRYRLLAPYNHVVVLSCRFEVYPNTCNTEHFYVSRDGDLQLREAESFCASEAFTRTSYFRAMTLAYQSASVTTSLQGRFFCQAYAQPQPCTCGWSLSSRITNGQQARPHEYPSIAALRDVASSQLLFCAGNIISQRHIVTAAHCLRTQPDPSRVVAYLGDHDLSSATESMFAVQHRIQQFIAHPAYASSANNVANDIALLVTVLPIEWSRGVGPICLPIRQSIEAFNYVNVDVAGWGTVSFAGAKSNTLQKVQLLTLENRVCEMQYNASIAPSQICTYDYRGLGQDSCQYDSGGPVIYRQQLQAQQQRLYLLGVISFGRTCGVRYAVGVNTRITAHLNWLWNYVGGAVCVA